MQAKEPVKLINRPNLGTTMAAIEVKITVIVRKNNLLAYDAFS